MAVMVAKIGFKASAIDRRIALNRNAGHGQWHHSALLPALHSWGVPVIWQRVLAGLIAQAALVANWWPRCHKAGDNFAANVM